MLRYPWRVQRRKFQLYTQCLPWGSNEQASSFYAKLQGALYKQVVKGMCVCVCTFACVCVHVHVCMRVCACAHTRACTCNSQQCSLPFKYCVYPCDPLYPGIRRIFFFWNLHRVRSGPRSGRRIQHLCAICWLTKDVSHLAFFMLVFLQSLPHRGLLIHRGSRLWTSVSFLLIICPAGLASDIGRTLLLFLRCS